MCPSFVAGLSKCQLERQKLLGWTGVAPPGSVVPQCEADGCFAHVQCLNGYCWCVDSSGYEIPDTRIKGRPICGKTSKSRDAIVKILCDYHCNVSIVIMWQIQL